MFPFTSSINRATIKSEQDLQKLYQLHAHAIYSMCMSKTADQELSKDIVQDIFLSLWERRNELELKEPEGHYLMRCAKLKIIDHYRKQEVRAKHAQSQNHADQTRNTENQIIYNDLNRLASQLSERLSPQCKRVFTSRSDQGLSGKEIAAKLGISERAVNQHLDKAYSYLRTQLDQHLYE